MTNHWVDIKNADVVLVMGGNAAEAHPCGFKWVMEAKAHNNAKLIVVDPRFTRTAAVADLYVPIRSGTDIIFLGGVIKYFYDNDLVHHEYVKNYTDFTFIVREDFAFADGFYSGWDADKNKYDKTSWDYEKGPDGFVKTDPTMTHPRCVGNLMRKHYAAYTPEMVERACGSPKDKFLEVCKLLGSCANSQRVATVLYALGWCHHSVGSQNVRIGAMVQLLMGNIGEAGGGTQALRGHSNVQGLTDLGLLSNQLPGYITLPNESEQDYGTFIATRTKKPLRKNQMSYWQNYAKFHVSLMKAWWGGAATAENHWCYDYLSKHDKQYDILQQMRYDVRGKIERLHLPGFQPAGHGAGQDPHDRGAVETQVPRHHGSPRHRNSRVLEEPYGALNDVDAGENRDRGLSSTDGLFRGGRRRHRQLFALAAVALARRRTAGRSARRWRDHVRAVLAS